jgi:putative transposase
VSNYRRWFVPGGTFFFTVVTHQRYPLFRDPEARTLLGDKIRYVQTRLPFETLAIVLLHDHLHAIWRLPPGDSDYSHRWRVIKGDFTATWCGGHGKEGHVSTAREARGNRGVWQRRFWEHTIEDEDDLRDYCDYIHYNPVKHGYVERPADWPHSSFARFVAAGEYEPGWGRCQPDTIKDMDVE